MRKKCALVQQCSWALDIIFGSLMSRWEVFLHGSYKHTATMNRKKRDDEKLNKQHENLIETNGKNALLETDKDWMLTHWMISHQSEAWCSFIKIKHSFNTSVYRIRDNTINWCCFLVSFYTYTYGRQGRQDANMRTINRANLKYLIFLQFCWNSSDESVCDIKSANNHNNNVKLSSASVKRLNGCHNESKYDDLYVYDSVNQLQNNNQLMFVYV